MVIDPLFLLSARGNMDEVQKIFRSWKDGRSVELLFKENEMSEKIP